MRSTSTVTVLSLWVLSLAALVPALTSPPGAAGSAAAPPASAAVTTPASAAADNAAAARHARRTACLKEARAKKLLGAQRTAFVKNCVGPR